MKRIQWFLFVLILAAISGCSKDDGRTLVIYHTNGIHGYIGSREAGNWNPKNPKRMVGGFAVLKNFIKEDKRPYLLLDSGDIFSGAPEGWLTKGDAVVELMNHLGYAAVSIGNHEFDQKESNIRRLAKTSKFPFLSSNIRIRHVLKAKEGEPPISDIPEYASQGKIVELPNLKLKIGIFGVISENTPLVTVPKNVERLKFLGPTASAKGAAENLRKEGCNLIIGLTTIGLNREARFSDKEEKMASRLKGVDVLLGGFERAAKREVYQESESKMIVAQSGYNLNSVTKITLTVDEKGGVIKWNSEIVDLWKDEYGEDEDTLKIIQKHKDTVDKQLSKVAGESKEDLVPDRENESAIGNLIADAFREKVQAEVAFQNSGGIRDALPKGPVTLKAIFTALPFDSTLVSMDLTGAQIRTMLEDVLAGEMVTRINVSGVKFRFNPRRPKQRRITQITVAGRPLSVTRAYRVVTNSFLAQGGDGYSVFTSGADKVDSGILMRDALADYFEKHSPVAPPDTDRIVEEK